MARWSDSYSSAEIKELENKRTQVFEYLRNLPIGSKIVLADITIKFGFPAEEVSEIFLVYRNFLLQFFYKNTVNGVFEELPRVGSWKKRTFIKKSESSASAIDRKSQWVSLRPIYKEVKPKICAWLNDYIDKAEPGKRMVPSSLYNEIDLPNKDNPVMRSAYMRLICARLKKYKSDGVLNFMMEKI